MKTILDNKKFRKYFKSRCIEENLHIFYLKSVIANFFSFTKNPKVFLNSDAGDEVFDAAYGALKDIGYIDESTDLKISPYDVLEMKAVGYGDNYSGMTVEFKAWCPNFGNDRSDRIACNVCSESCGQYVNCGKFYYWHNKKY